MLGTHIYFFKTIRIYSTKVKNPSDGFFTHIFFAGKTIPIFGDLSIHHPSRIYQFKFKCPKASEDDLAKEKCGIIKNHPKAGKPSWKAINKPPKGHTKGRNFSTTQY